MKLEEEIFHKVVFAWADDWVGLYIDDILVKEGHEITAWEALEIIKQKEIKHYNMSGFDVDLDWIHDLGNLPEKLEDVKREN